MVLRLPKWVRVVIFVPGDEVSRTKELLRDAKAKGMNIQWIVTGTQKPWSEARSSKLCIEEQSKGDVEVIVFTGMYDDSSRAPWSVVASAPVGRLQRFLTKYPRHINFVLLVQEIMNRCLIEILEPEEPRPYVVVMENEEKCRGK